MQGIFVAHCIELCMSYLLLPSMDRMSDERRVVEAEEVTGLPADVESNHSCQVVTNNMSYSE